MQNAMTPAIKAKYATLAPLLDERTRRLWAAVEAQAIGRGGITRVAEATGLSQTTIRAGLQELASQSTSDTHNVTSERVRRPGGGRPAGSAGGLHCCPGVGRPGRPRHRHAQPRLAPRHFVHSRNRP